MYFPGEVVLHLLGVKVQENSPSGKINQNKIEVFPVTMKAS